MGKTSIKERLTELLAERTAAFDGTDSAPLCAAALAQALGGSRTVVSQYLNELWLEGRTVKVLDRPVLYLWADALREKGALPEENSFDSLESFRQAMAEGHRSVFDRLVGSRGSLAGCIEQCRAAISYPGAGLPVLLYGPTGTGKTSIATLLYEYAQENGILSPDARFVHVNCSEYANNPELFLANLLGHTKSAYTGADRSREGLLALADGGLLFLDEIHCLTSECQEKLFQFMDKGTYHRLGDNDKWYHSSVRLVFATTEDPKTALLRTLLRRIPIIACVPSLAERPLSERREMIFRFLSGEQDRIGRSIRISSGALQLLMRHRFPGAAGDLFNCVRACLARAILYARGDTVDIVLSCLPQEIISAAPDFLPKQGTQKLLTLEELAQSQKPDSFLQRIHRDLLALASQFSLPQETELLLRESQGAVNKILDYLYFQNQSREEETSPISPQLLENYFTRASRSAGVEMPSGQEIDAAARLIGEWADLRLGTEERRALTRLCACLRMTDLPCWTMLEEVVALLSGALSSQAPTSILVMDLFLMYHCFHDMGQDRARPCIIAAHGRATASSMAQAVNALLDAHIFEAIDMPVDTNALQVVSKINARLRRYAGLSEALVLVDMGSLETMEANLEPCEGMSIGFANNVTTKLALDIGTAILAGDQLKDALETACTRSSFSFSYRVNRRRRNVILTVCSTGTFTAEKIASLLRSSLPPERELTILPYDFQSLRTLGLDSPVFASDQVLLIVGTMDPGVPDVPFVPLQSLIAGEGETDLSALLQGHLNGREAEVFERQLVKNFSLMNLLDHLTILNPEKIITQVEQIVDQIQEVLGMRFRQGTVFGLYVHISCLIERLITGQYISDYPNEDAFAAARPDFIALARQCFRQVEMGYRVEIPVSEIGYLYEYIHYAVEEAGGEEVSKNA